MSVEPSAFATFLERAWGRVWDDYIVLPTTPERGDESWDIDDQEDEE